MVGNMNAGKYDVSESGKIVIRRPDNFHLHLRDGEAMQAVVPHSARRFGRALIMPNLRPPITKVEQALAYRERILGALRKGTLFQPLMAIYLTDKTTPEEIARAAAHPHIIAAKFYPAGATTNSDDGVTDIRKMGRVLEAMEEGNLPLCLHAELLSDENGEVDVFDRERRFIEKHVYELAERYPRLPIVLEHITTAIAVEFVALARERIAATITAHHLLENRNVIFREGINPHHYCLPILKREADRQNLLIAATSGNPRFFLGTDSAPHSQQSKESACGCAGCFTDHAGIELYAEAFESIGALGRLENFASRFGAEFYGLPLNEGTITLVKQDRRIPDRYPFGKHNVVPYRAGKSVLWTLEDFAHH